MSAVVHPVSVNLRGLRSIEIQRVARLRNTNPQLLRESLPSVGVAVRNLRDDLRHVLVWEPAELNVNIAIVG